MKGSLLLYNLKLNCLIFSTGLNGSLIIFIRTYTVNHRNALDRLYVRINIILLLRVSVQYYVVVSMFLLLFALAQYSIQYYESLFKRSFTIYQFLLCSVLLHNAGI